MASCVVFNPPLRTSSKRKRMPGTNKDAKEECKKMAMFTATTNIQDIYQLFKFSSVLGAYTSDSSHVIRGSWMPIEVRHPAQGTNGFNRIGQSFFLKYFRLKGYCTVRSNCVRPIHWRLRLIRVEDEAVFTLPSQGTGSISANYVDVVNSYLSTMYRNPTMIASGDSTEIKSQKLAENYYCGLKTQLENKTIDSKVIATGTVAPSNILTSAANALPADQVAHEGFSYNSLGDLPEDFAYTKLDCRVVLNDNISYNLWKNSSGTSSLVSNVDYFVVMETDCCYGMDIYEANTGGSGNEKVGGFRKTLQSTDEQFNLIFTQIEYFTDP